MTARQKIQAARTALVLDEPFWASLVLLAKIVETEDVPMGATDGTHLLYNPRYVESIPCSEVLGLLAEEVAHNAHGHVWRRDGRDPQQWNVACDRALSCELKQAGFDIGPMLHDPHDMGKSAEWIYARLPQEQSGGGCSLMPPDGGAGHGNGRPKPGSGHGQAGRSGHGGGRILVLDAPSGGDVDGTSPLTEEDWRQAVQQAAAAAKGRGKLPASVARLIESTATSRVDWRSVLHRFVQQAAHDDYSWIRPNLRYLAGGLYLPALRSETVGPIAVAIDTSGSIDDVLLNQFTAELRSVVDDVRPARVHVLYCDAKVHRVDTFERDDAVELKPVGGGGGTDFRPVFKAVQDLDEPPACLIYLTDGNGAYPDQPPDWPVLWAMSTDQRPPFGETVRLE